MTNLNLKKRAPPFDRNTIAATTRPIFSALLPIALCACAQLQDAANRMAAMAPTLGINESFEAPATSNYTVYRAGQTFTTQTNTWTIESGSIDLVNTQARKEAPAATGIQSVDLAGSPGPGTMSMRFSTMPGRTYMLTFAYGRNNGIGNAPARAQVQVLGTGAPMLQADLQHQAPLPFNAMQRYSGGFVADSASSVLRFVSQTGGSYGLMVDAINISSSGAAAAAPAPTQDLSGEYTYLGKGVSTITQQGNEVTILSTWTPIPGGPHYEAHGRLNGDTITGQWYSRYHRKGWFKYVGHLLPNGDIEQSQSEDSINANLRKAVLSRRR